MFNKKQKQQDCPYCSRSGNCPGILLRINHPVEDRMVTIERENDSYTFQEHYFSHDEYEMCWIPLKNNSLAICDSPDTALREAIGRVDWLAEILNQR